MKTFEVWREGFDHGDEYSQALLLGEAEADTFAEACVIVLGEDELFRPENLTHWGLGLYRDESIARIRNG